MTVLIICNIIPTCAGRKPEISRSFACPPILDLQKGVAMPSDISLPHIIGFSPQIAPVNEMVFVNVNGIGFDKKSQLLINGFFVVGKKYMRIVNENQAIVKVPKGVPKGRYSVVIKNPDGKTSNEVWFEVRS